MNNNRSLLTFTGAACILLGVFLVVALICRMIGSGLDLIQTQGDSPDGIIELLVNGWYQTSLVLLLVSYMILVPVTVGIHAFLKKTANGFALIGLAFGGIAFLLILLSQLIETGLIFWLTPLGIQQSHSIKSDAFEIYRLVKYLRYPAVVPAILFFYFVGSAFRRLENPARLVGILFLSEIPLIFFTAIFDQFEVRLATFSFALLAALAFSFAFIFAGWAIFNTGKDEPAPI
ncbi:hypothetical protein JXJ21_05560 [candidate division KSB1 bacterium]|nr:hypothetical protein [candidate division KSB1 bacterium]